VLQAFSQALVQPTAPANMHIDASIQRFEFSIELSWKLLKHILESLGIQANSPKDIMRQAYANKLINDEQI
jgi:nucleotidyltransferase substrate binding protein (TIGR01987 family)